LRCASAILTLLLTLSAAEEGLARPVDCRLGSIAFARTGYLIDITHPHVRIAARVVPGWSRDPTFDWIPDDLASRILYQDPQLLGLVWSSSDTAIVSVDEKGRLKAASVGTALVTARAAQITPQSATVSVVELGAQTVIVPTIDIVGRTEKGIELRKTSLTKALRPGQVVVAADGSLVARLSDTRHGLGATLHFRIAPASAEEAFAAGNVAPPAEASCI